MAINKVVYGADTLVDLTEDTVTAEDVLNSKTFHTPDGVKRTGTASYPVTDVQVNGTSVMDGTIAKVEQPTAEEKTATDQFNTANGGLLSKCQINLVPVQSGSGDPYPAGGGKNKLQNTATSNTVKGVTFTVNSDGTVTANGTATDYVSITIYDRNVSCPYNGYILSGCPSGGSNTTYEIRVSDVTTTSSADYGEGRTINLADTGKWRVLLIVRSGITVNNLLFKPMIRLATETDPTFAPYSNVRPISGHTEVGLRVDGKNFLPMTVDGVKAINTGGTWTGDVYTFFNITYSLVINNGVINGILVNGTTTQYPNFDVAECSFPLGTYTFVKKNLRYRVLKNGTQVNDGSTDYTFTVDDESDVYRFRLFTGAGTFRDILYTPIVCLSSESDKSFEPYNGYQLTVNLGETYYGGTLDVVSGELTPDRKYKKGFTRGALDTSGKLYKIDELSDAVNITSSSGAADLDESNMGIFLGLTPARNSADFCLTQYGKSFYVGGMIGKETELDALLPNLEIVYELATPQKIQLTPQQIETLAGQNNFSTPLSGQSIETNGVEYKELFTFADVKEYVNVRSSSRINYSTEEHVVGTWIDGKPLYEKTVSFTTGNSDAYLTYDTGIENPEMMSIDFSASFYVTGDAIVNATPYFGTLETGDSNVFETLCNKVDNKIRLDYRVGSSAYSKFTLVTIRYTKTTD